MRPERLTICTQGLRDSIEDLDNRLEDENDPEVVKQLFNAKREAQATLKDLTERN